MKIEKDNIVISLSETLFSLSNDNIRQIFETGLIEGCFDDLIEDLLAGEIFGDSYSTKFEVKHGGLTIDFLNELRIKIVKSLSDLEKMSFDYEHGLYVHSQKDLELAKECNDRKDVEIRTLRSKLDKANLCIDACYNIDAKFIDTQHEADRETHYDAVIENLEEYKKNQ